MRRQWEEEKVRQAIQASMEEENLRKALELSKRDQLQKMDDQRVQAAIQASLQQQQRQYGAYPPARQA